MHKIAHAPVPADVLTRALLSAAQRLGLRNRELAAIGGSSEASISRLQRGRTVDPASKEGELGLLFLRLYRSLDALVGGDDGRARAWLHGLNEHVGGVPAERPVEPGDIAATWADPALAHELLGWRATRTLDDMAADTWRWQSQNPEGYPAPA